MDAAAYRVLADIGRTLTLRRVSVSSYDPTTSKATASTSNTSCVGAILQYKNFEAGGTQVQTGDRKIVLDAVSITARPSIGDMVIAGSEKYKIVGVQVIEKGGAACVYICQGRAA